MQVVHKSTKALRKTNRVFLAFPNARKRQKNRRRGFTSSARNAHRSLRWMEAAFEEAEAEVAAAEVLAQVHANEQALLADPPNPARGLESLFGVDLALPIDAEVAPPFDDGLPPDAWDHDAEVGDAQWLEASELAERRRQQEYVRRRIEEEERRRAEVERQELIEARQAATPLSEMGDCPICLERLDDPDHGSVVRLGCGCTPDHPHGHTFHAECLHRTWQMDPSRAPDARLRCPTCRLSASPEQRAEASAGYHALRVQQQHEASLAADLLDRRTHWDGLADTPRDEDIDDAQPPGPPVPGGWHAIDELPIVDCVVSFSSHLMDVPTELRVRWARAHEEIFRYISTARQQHDDVALERGLKWHLVLHDMLLRGPSRGTRGGARSTSFVARRFDAWADGERERLVQWWQEDRSRAVRMRRGRAAPQPDTLEAVYELIRDGELSTAAARLHSLASRSCRRACSASEKARSARPRSPNSPWPDSSVAWWYRPHRDLPCSEAPPWHGESGLRNAFRALVGMYAWALPLSAIVENAGLGVLRNTGCLGVCVVLSHSG